MKFDRLVSATAIRWNPVRSLPRSHITVSMRFVPNFIRRMWAKPSSHPSKSDDPVREPEVETQRAIPGDNPIQSTAEDTLNRATAARAFASHLLRLDASEGVVTAVLGPWGSGKTSFVNMATAHVQAQGIPVISFNPWMFSGSESLVSAFFGQISAQLQNRSRFESLGTALEHYGEALSGVGALPFVGPWVEGAHKAAKGLVRLGDKNAGSLDTRRQRIVAALADLRTPIVVVLDDIDRLDSSEVRTVFKLVRLTASFPQVIYVLAFDRMRVEQALSEDGIPGRLYLEKIVQFAIDLPILSAPVLQSQLVDSMSRALDDIPNVSEVDQSVWPDVLFEIIRPLVSSMRDVRRYCAALASTVRELNGQVALADMLALEAIRVFLPDTFLQMQRSLDALTTTAGHAFSSQSDPGLKADIEQLLRVTPTHERVARATLARLFPACLRHIGGSTFGADWSNRWIKDRRVAHRDVLRLYFERVAGESLVVYGQAGQAFRLMSDPEGLENYLLSLPREQLQDVISALEAYQDEFSEKLVIPGCTAILNVMTELPDRPITIFSFKSKIAPLRIVVRFLRVLLTPDSKEKSVQAILGQVRSLYAQSEFIRLAGHRENVGLALVSEPIASQMEADWRIRVRRMSQDDLLAEKEVLRVLVRARKERQAGEPDISVPSSPEFTSRILSEARTETISQVMGNRAMSSSPWLRWDALQLLYGDDAGIKERIDDLRSDADPEMVNTLALADKYLGGWRPSDE